MKLPPRWLYPCPYIGVYVRPGFNRISYYAALLHSQVVVGLNLKYVVQ